MNPNQRNSPKVLTVDQSLTVDSWWFVSMTQSLLSRSFKAIPVVLVRTQGKDCGVKANEACVQNLSLLHRFSGP